MASVDELLAQTRALTQSQQQGPSTDDLLVQTRSIVPGPQAAPKTTEPPISAYSDTTGGDQNLPSWMMQSPPSLEDIRDRIQKGDINALSWLKTNLDPGAPPTSGLGALKYTALEQGKEAAMTGVHLGANLLQLPLNIAIGMSQGPGEGALTIDPNTNQVRLTPEAQAAGSVVANPLRFSGSTPLAAVPSGTLDRRAPLSPEFQANPMTTEARAAAATPPSGPATQTGIAPPPKPAPSAIEQGAGPALSPEDAQWATGIRSRLEEIAQENREAGIPGSVGAAATPEDLAKLTPAQTKAYRKQAELGEILAPPDRGMDRSVYVHGSEPTLAEYSGDAAVSQKERLYRQRGAKEYDARLEQNNAARVKAYENLEGTAPQLQDLRDAKAAAAEKDGAAFMRVARPLDLNPALRWIDEKLADPRIRESPDRVKVLGELRKALYDETGNLKTDPGSGWGMHDNLIDRLDKAGDRTASERYATKLLTEYKKIVDGVNNAASDGAFQTFLDNQTSFAQRINSMEELQKFRQKFTNNKGEVNATAFHKFVTDLAVRRARSGVDPAMGISDETMRGLINIDKDLKRATNIDLGKARGSETNLFFTLAQATGIGAAHLATAAMTAGAPVANIVLQGAMNQASRLGGNLLLRRAVRRGLSPPPGGYDYNPIIPPSP